MLLERLLQRPADSAVRACLLVLAVSLPLRAARSADLADLLDEGGDALLDAVVEEALAEDDAEWWDASWRYRQKIVVEDPGLPLRRPPVVAVSTPDPLLLYNTGRALRDLADLRVVTPGGSVLRSGVAHFGRDDGTASIWFVAGGESGTKLVAYLYYGNPEAESVADDLPPPAVVPDAAATVHLQPEEVHSGATLPGRAQRGSFPTNIVAIEAEHFTAADGSAKTAIGPRAEAGASAGRILVCSAGAEPVTARTTADIPRAGEWYVHLRRRNRPGDSSKDCTLFVRDRAVDMVPSDDREAAFTWDRATVSLVAGEAELAFRMTGKAAPDCLFMTQDARYLPDYRDMTGPVWMRFRAPAGFGDRFYIHLFGMHTPYSAEGMKGDTACWLFRNHVAFTAAGCDVLVNEGDAFLEGGEWSAWGESLHSGAYTWFSKVTLLVPSPMTPHAARDLDIEFELATRPDASRIFRHGTERTTPGRQMNVRMPTSLAWEGSGGLQLTESFSQWARRRFRMVEAYGFAPGEGPTRIVAGTMAQAAQNEEELEYLIKTCDLLGLNLLDTHYHDQAVLNERTGRNGIYWTMHHHLAYGVGSGTLTNAAAGRTFAGTLEERLSASADDVFRRHAERAASMAGKDGPEPDRYPHVRYGVLGDEIAEVINSISINQSPFNRGLFVEFLQDHGLAPELFGADSWDAFRAVDYATLHPKTVENMESRLAGIHATLGASKEQQRSLEARLSAEETDDAGLDELLADVTGEQEGDDTDDLAAISEEDRQFLEWAAEVQRNTEAKERMREGLATPEEKRLYHWTQRFKNDYYCRYFRVVSDAARRHFPPPFNASVNLQAEPVQGARMWGGQCNIFELGRKKAFGTLHVEDWDWRSLHVAFAMNILRAAARRHGQPLTALITGSNPSERIVANLAQGTRHLLFYLYGPIHCIGPVWAEHQPTLGQIGRTMRQVARCEPDILAATNRVADAAVLVANTSEINATYRNLGFAAERRALYRALLEAHVPVDVVGEEEIVEDGALDRYRLLCIGDSHVDGAAQRLIGEWVKAGGVVFATGAAAGYREYDERCTTLNEVFGLRERGPGVLRSSTDDVEPVQIEFSETAWFPPMEIAMTEELPEWDVSDGVDVCASAAGAGPAVIHHAYGRGHAFLTAFRLAPLYRAKDRPSAYAVPPQLVSAAARTGGVREHVRIDGQPGLWAWVHEGPTQTVAYVIGKADSGPNSETIEVVLSRPVTAAYSGSAGPLSVTEGEDSAIVPLSLGPDGVEIIVLRHKALNR